MPRQIEAAFMAELRPSARIMKIMVFIHLLAWIACLASAMAISIKFGISLLISIHLWHFSKNHSFQRYDQIRYSEDSGWSLMSPDGFEPVRILKSSLITTFVIILHLKTQKNNKLTILITNDALSDDIYRQLIVKLLTIAKEKQEKLWP